MYVFSFEVSDLIAICDDLALPIGKIRIRNQGSAGGRSSLKSVLSSGSSVLPSALDLPDVEDFEAAEYVLTPFPIVSETIDQLVVRENVKAICLDCDAIMNQFN
jgi:PTH1 family peptidyl-tRNA hydrolase